MTTIAIAKELFALTPSRPRVLAHPRVWARPQRALLMARSGIIAWALFLLLGALVLAYLAGLFMSFELGFELRELETRRAAMLETLERAEFAYQEKARLTAIASHPFISEMRPVASITYIQEENAVALKREE